MINLKKKIIKKINLKQKFNLNYLNKKNILKIKFIEYYL